MRPLPLLPLPCMAGPVCQGCLHDALAILKTSWRHDDVGMQTVVVTCGSAGTRTFV